MHHTRCSVVGRCGACVARLLLCVGLIAASTGCHPARTILLPGGQGSDHSAPVADLSLGGQAATAWERGNMAEAERLYGVLARNADTPAEDRAPAFERLTLAALANRHPHTVLDALQQWRAFDITAPTLPAWQQAWARALMQLPLAESRRRATLIWHDEGREPSLRAQAGGVLLLHGTELERTTLAPQLTSLYQGADVPARQTMERGLAALLHDAPDSRVTSLVHLTGPETDRQFPWSVVLLEAARREGVLGGGQASELLARIGGPGVFADPSLLSGAEDVPPAPGTDPATTGAVDMHGGCYVLALPLSGGYETFGRKVARGATAAQQELIRNGLSVEVKLLDTENPQWLDELAALPARCAAVGGPLRPDAYATAKARGLTAQRAFFTFFPQLDAQDEGVSAWRFFTAPGDQVAAMLRFARELGLSRYAVLHPEDNYGRRMNDLFLQAAGTDVLTTAAYSTDNPKAWNDITRKLVGGYMQGKTPVSSAKFQAVFLPDGWDQSVGIIPYLFFHGEDRLLLMGTTLWEQALSEKQFLGEKTRVDTENLGLAVFPGVWNNVTPTAAAAVLIDTLAATGDHADFWVGLGYDFVRFASAMGLTDVWTPEEVNNSIQQAQNMAWSMAPLRWNNGRASQQLFVFTPTVSGFEPADVEVFRERLDKVRQAYNRRVGSARRGG